MQNRESKNFGNPITDKVYYYIASILYSKCSIPWDELKPISLFLYQNFQYGPKGTRELSARLYRIYSLLYEKNLAYPSVLHDEKGECISYGEMQANKNTNAFKNIEELTNQMIKDFKNEDAVNKYIFYLKERMEKYVSYLVRKKEIDSTIGETIQKEMLELMDKKRTAPEDIFHQVKRMKNLLSQNNEIKQQKELENRKKQEEIRTKNKPEVDRINALFYGAEEEKEKILQRAEATLERMCVLQEITKDEICKMVLAQDIFQFRCSLLSGNIDAIQNDIERFEDIFATSTRRSR